MTPNLRLRPHLSQPGCVSKLRYHTASNRLCLSCFIYQATPDRFIFISLLHEPNRLFQPPVGPRHVKYKHIGMLLHRTSPLSPVFPSTVLTPNDQRLTVPCRLGILPGTRTQLTRVTSPGSQRCMATPMPAQLLMSGTKWTSAPCCTLPTSLPVSRQQVSSWVITCVFNFACCVVKQQLNCMNATAGARCAVLIAAHLVLLCTLTMQAYL